MEQALNGQIVQNNTMDAADLSRLAVLESKHANLYERLYGSEGRQGDMDRLIQKMDSIVQWQQRCVGAAVLVTVIIPLVEHFWK